MNRQKQQEAHDWRMRIFDMHTLRSQAEPRLTIKRLSHLCEGKLSASTIRRHLAWLRAKKYLSG
ncbi:MAG TPA: hypothetical protein VGP20_02800 [Steroidobacteraceae bacterium]|nr:hypothetical protein [Steroidobacteraceae bacterium]